MVGQLRMEKASAEIVIININKEEGTVIKEIEVHLLEVLVDPGQVGLVLVPGGQGLDLVALDMDMGTVQDMGMGLDQDQDMVPDMGMDLDQGMGPDQGMVMEGLDHQVLVRDRGHHKDLHLDHEDPDQGPWDLALDQEDRHHLDLDKGPLVKDCQGQDQTKGHHDLEWGLVFPQEIRDLLHLVWEDPQDRLDRLLGHLEAHQGGQDLDRWMLEAPLLGLDLNGINLLPLELAVHTILLVRLLLDLPRDPQMAPHKDCPQLVMEVHLLAMVLHLAIPQPPHPMLILPSFLPLHPHLLLASLYHLPALTCRHKTRIPMADPLLPRIQ